MRTPFTGVGTALVTPFTKSGDLDEAAVRRLARRQIADAENAIGLEQNKSASKQGGGIARKARRELEGRTGKSVVTGQNFLPPKK